MKKSYIILSAILFVLLAGVEIYVQSDSFASRIRPYVVEPLKTVLGEDVKIGLVKANFIPLYLEVRDISFPDAAANQIASIRKVKVYLNPVPLLVKKIRLSSISIIEPRIHAERSRTGVLNLAPLVERITSNVAHIHGDGHSRFNVLLRSITVVNGIVEFVDDLSSARFSVTGINMIVGIDLPQERFNTVIRSARIRFSAPAYPELSGDLKSAGEYYRDVLHISSAELTTADASIAVSGDVGTLPGSVLDLTLSAKSGPKTLKKFTDLLKTSRKQEASRMTASATIRGTTSDPIIEGSMKLSAIAVRDMTLRDASVSFSYRSGKISINGKKWKLSSSDKSIFINSIEADLGYARGVFALNRVVVLADDLVLRVEGKAGLSFGLSADVGAESSGKGRTLSFFTSMPIEGAVAVKGSLSGALNRPRFDGILTAGPLNVRGVLFNKVNGVLGYGDKKISLTSVDIHEQTSYYVLNGFVDLNKKDPVYSARLRVLRSDVVNIVALFYEQLPLRLSAEGELSFDGTARNYSGSGYLKLGPGSAYGESFVRGAITAKLTNGKIAFPQVVLYKERGNVKATGWIGFDGTYSADLEGRDVGLSSVDHLAGVPVDGEFKLDVHSSGSFSHPAVKALLEVDSLIYQKTLAGRVVARAEIRDGLFTANAGLSEDRAAVSVHWTLRKPYPWKAEIRVRPEAIDPLLLAGSKDLSGKVKVIADGTLTARGQGLDASSVSGEVNFKQLSFVIGDLKIDSESDARIKIVGGKISISALNFVGSGTRIGVTGWVSSKAKVALDLQGTADLSLLKLLYREVEHAGGTADVKLAVKDDWKNPDIAGELRIQNGEIKVRDIPQRFSALNGRIFVSQGRIVADSLSGQMGGGTLNVSGRAQLDGVALRDFSIKSVVENVMVRYPEGLVSTLSGNLYYEGDASEQSLTGDVAIKQARYDKRIEWKTMMVDISRGLYQKKKTDIIWIGDTQINVRFHGADNILFQNNLATMSLDVDVFLRGTVNHPQLLGRIESRKGVVFFRKNEFKILNASADFVDPGRLNPVIDIQAETKVREYLILLSVTGTADHAVVTFISDPSLIDSDILSVLALGKTGSELKGKETGVGVGEATSFASGQFQDFLERQSRSLTGLDRFQIDPYISKSDASVPRVTMGKELVKNKLYLTYSSNVGATTPEQMFRIEYLLNMHYSLVGEQDDTGNIGADIKYRFEFK